MTRARLPYPGLRSFKREESDLFFGRDDDVDTIVRRLIDNRFVAVLGASGSGKSSLVRAGVLEELEGGRSSAGANWKVADCRPGGNPIANLARALHASIGVPDPSTEESILLEARLRRGPRSIAEWCADGALPGGWRLLLLVDQFEELFNYGGAAAREDAQTYAGLVVEAAQSPDIYVIVTMRSDYFGACGLYPALADTISRSIYLTPRMYRENCRKAIVNPSKVLGFGLSTELVTTLLNDMERFAPFVDGVSAGAERAARQADQLPLMQYALNRMWLAAGSNELTPDDYKTVGKLEGVLDLGGERALETLDATEQAGVERVFRALVRGPNVAMATRDPHSVDEIAAITGLSVATVMQVVNAFASDDCQFLRIDRPVTSTSFVDINHESLIRQWRTLARWVDREAVSAEAWLALARETRLARPARDEVLQHHRVWWDDQRPTQAWADRYPLATGGGQSVTVAAASAFLETSERAEAARLKVEDERLVAEAQRARRTRSKKQWLAAAFAALFVAAGLFFIKSREDQQFARFERLRDRAGLVAILERQTSNLIKTIEELKISDQKNYALRKTAQNALVSARLATGRAQIEAARAQNSLAALQDSNRAMQSQLVSRAIELEGRHDEPDASRADVLTRVNDTVKDFKAPAMRGGVGRERFARLSLLAGEATISNIGLTFPAETAAGDVARNADNARRASASREVAGRSHLIEGRVSELRGDYATAARHFKTAFDIAVAGGAGPHDDIGFTAAGHLIRLNRRMGETPATDTAAAWCEKARQPGKSVRTPEVFCLAAIAELWLERGDRNKAWAMFEDLRRDLVAATPGADNGVPAGRRSVARLRLNMMLLLLGDRMGDDPDLASLKAEARRYQEANPGTEEAALFLAQALSWNDLDSGETREAYEVLQPLLLIRKRASTEFLLEADPMLKSISAYEWQFEANESDDNLSEPAFAQEVKRVRQLLWLTRYATAHLAVVAELSQRRAPEIRPYDFSSVSKDWQRRAWSLKAAEAGTLFRDRIALLSREMTKLAERSSDPDLIRDLRASPKTYLTAGERTRLRTLDGLRTEIQSLCDLASATEGECRSLLAASRKDQVPLPDYERLPLVNQPAFDGYDPVALVRDGTKVRGRVDVRFDPPDAAGRTYLFASETHKAAFDKDPDKYRPAYDGNAIDLIDSDNDLYPGKAALPCVESGRIYLFFWPEKHQEFCKKGDPGRRFAALVARASLNHKLQRPNEPRAPAFVDPISGARVTPDDSSKTVPLKRGLMSIKAPRGGRLVVNSADHIDIRQPDGSQTHLALTNATFDLSDDDRKDQRIVSRGELLRISRKKGAGAEAARLSWKIISRADTPRSTTRVRTSP